jgi:hypothetical protein
MLAVLNDPTVIDIEPEGSCRVALRYGIIGTPPRQRRAAMETAGDERIPNRPI